MTYKKFKKYYYTVVILLITAYAINVGYKFYVAVSEKNTVSTKIPREYLELFPKDTQVLMGSYLTHISSTRSNVSTIDLGQYCKLVLFKLPLTEDIALEKLIEVRRERSNLTTNITYKDISQRAYALKYRTGKFLPVSKIYLSVDDEGPTFIKENDTIRCYSLKLKNFSIKYQEEGDVDIWGESESKGFLKTKPIPMNLLFLKKGTVVYFLILSTNNDRVKLADNYLFDLLTKQ